MSEHVEKSAVPEDPRLSRRDPPGVLAEGQLLRYQRISRGKNPANNVHWILHDDGSLRAAWHSGTVADRDQPFDVPIPDEPTGEVPRSKVRRLRRLLRKVEFGDQVPDESVAAVKDGDYVVVTARLRGAVHEVVYTSGAPQHEELLTALGEITDRYAGHSR